MKAQPNTQQDLLQCIKRAFSVIMRCQKKKNLGHRGT